MKDIEYTSDGSLAICPYCGNSYQVECEDYSEAGREEKCDKCGKIYLYETCFNVTHYCKPIVNGKAEFFAEIPDDNEVIK